MIDMHSHIIPFVDDGSPSLEDSLKMIEDEINQGVDVIVCTPHFRYPQYVLEVDKIKEQFNALKEEVIKREYKVELLLGQEICFTKHVDLIKMLDNKELLSMNDSKYILLEFSFSREPDDICEYIYNLSCHGFVPIIAHVERYEWLKMSLLEDMLNEGALLQINSGSIMNKEGHHFYKKAKQYLKRGMISFIASDVHSFRENHLGDAMKKYGKYLDGRLVNFNAKK